MKLNDDLSRCERSGLDGVVGTVGWVDGLAISFGVQNLGGERDEKTRYDTKTSFYLWGFLWHACFSLSFLFYLFLVLDRLLLCLLRWAMESSPGQIWPETQGWLSRAVTGPEWMGGTLFSAVFSCDGSADSFWSWERTICFMSGRP